MRFTVLWSSVLAVCLAAAHPAAAAGAVPTLGTPHIFAPGALSGPQNDGSPAFSPDGNTMLFSRSGANWGVIMESDRTGGTWSEPRVASFSGQWSEWAPEFSPDGRYVIYVSVRKGIGANLWRVDRTATGWGTPDRLPDAVNIGKSIWKSSIVSDGSIYLTAIDQKGNKRLYRSQFADGVYQPAQPLPFSSGTTGDDDPEVAHDESFMIFASDGRIAGDTKDHLFISFKRGGTWSEPERLRYQGDEVNGPSTDNEPHLSPDGRTLYFSSDRYLTVTFPRTIEQARADLARMREFGNGSTNAWSVPLDPLRS